MTHLLITLKIFCTIYLLSSYSSTYAHQSETLLLDKVTTKIKMLSLSEQHSRSTLKNPSLPEVSKTQSELTSQKTPPSSPSRPFRLLLKEQDSQPFSLVAAINIRELNHLKRNYDSPFVLSLTNSCDPSINYTYEFKDIDLELGKNITLTQDLPFCIKRMIPYFSYSFMGYPKTKDRDTIFDFENNEDNFYKQQVIDKGEIRKGTGQRALLKYCSSIDSSNQSLTIYLNIRLFEHDQTNASIVMAKPIRQSP